MAFRQADTRRKEIDRRSANPGLPTLTAVSKFPLSTPYSPPWPEPRSITATSASGSERSISAAFCPTFCARAWQARWIVTPPTSGDSPGVSPSLRATSTDVFADAKSGGRQFSGGRVVRQDQRPFEFEHQRTGGDQGDDIVTLVDPGAESHGNLGSGSGGRCEVALLELRHAVTTNVDRLGLDPVAGKDRAGRLADARVVAIDKAGRVEDRLAAGGRGRTVDRGSRSFRPHHEGAAVKTRTASRSIPSAFSIADHVTRFFRSFAQLTSDAAKAASRPLRLVLASSCCGRGTFLLMQLRTVAQHDAREIDIELVRRHVGTLCHKAPVAERAGIRDLAVVGDRDRFEFPGRGTVDQIKRVAQVEAPPAGVTNVPDSVRISASVFVRSVKLASSHPITVGGRDLGAARIRRGSN